jgi:predicted kinase
MADSKLLIITRGLPGSGKTTWAKSQRNAWRVNREELRAMYTGVWNYQSSELENLISDIQQQMIRILLLAGHKVIADDTNLDWAHVDQLVNVARSLNVVWQIQDFTHVPLEICIERDAARDLSLGRLKIMNMHAKYLAGGIG